MPAAIAARYTSRQEHNGSNTDARGRVFPALSLIAVGFDHSAAAVTTRSRLLLGFSSLGMTMPEGPRDL
jgi:hypothetical protein